MAIVEDRLKQSIVDAINKCQKNENDAESAKDILASAIASAVVIELQNAEISYTGGLVAPNGPVTGTFEGQLQ